MRLSFLVAAALALSCSTPPPDPGPGDAGEPADDPCNSAGAAASEGNKDACWLTLGKELSGYISKVGDTDWYLLDVPGPLDKRGILTVHAQYKVPSTPVTLLVNLLEADGTTSLGAASDKKLRGAPGPVEVVARLTHPGKYFVVVSHDASADDPAFDKKAPYLLSATLANDPDENEPNDVIPTAIVLPKCGVARVSGALATTADLDRFTFTLDPCAGRTILHLLLTAPKASAQQLRLSYTLKNVTTNVVVASGFASTPFGVQTLVDARLVAAGKYELVISAYKPPGATSDPSGDPAFTYTADLSLFSDVDANEGATGNDTVANATPVPLSPGQSKTLTGRLSYVPDVDYIAVKVGPVSRPTRLHYRFNSTAAPGRFIAVPSTQAKELNLVTLTLSATDCKANCPGGKDVPAVDWCNRSQCLWSRRVEDATLAFRNFEGQIEVPANSAGPWLFQVGYIGQAGADDREYTLIIDSREETADEQSPNNTRQTAMPVTLPAPAKTALGYGFGRNTQDSAPNKLMLLPHGPADYDAVSDTDFFEVNFSLPPGPASDGGTLDAGPPAGPDLSWDLSWTVPSSTGRAGERPHDVSFRFHFCNDVTCSSLTSTAAFLGYTGASGQTWYAAGAGSPGSNERFFDFDPATNRFTVRRALCLCIDGKYTAAKKFFVEVRADNRASYDDVDTSLDMAVRAYDTKVPVDGGTPFTCPSPCQFVAKSK